MIGFFYDYVKCELSDGPICIKQWRSPLVSVWLFVIKIAFIASYRQIDATGGKIRGSSHRRGMLNRARFRQD